MKKLKPFRFQLFQILSYRSLRGLAPEPPVSLATPRGQGSPLRFDTQPTGWSVGSATRHQGGIRKDCSAALLNLYKASPLTPFRFPPNFRQCRFWPSSPKSCRGKSGGAGFGQSPRRAGGESPAVQGLALVSEELPGKVRRCRVWPSFPESCPGKVRRCRFWPSSRKSRRGKSSGAGFGRRSRRSRRPAGRFRRPPESILLAAKDDKSRRNRGQYDNDVLNFFSKSANLVVFEFVGLPDNLELTGLRTNSRSL